MLHNGLLLRSRLLLVLLTVLTVAVAVTIGSLILTATTNPPVATSSVSSGTLVQTRNVSLVLPPAWSLDRGPGDVNTPTRQYLLLVRNAGAPLGHWKASILIYLDQNPPASPQEWKAALARGATGFRESQARVAGLPAYTCCLVERIHRTGMHDFDVSCRWWQVSKGRYTLQIEGGHRPGIKDADAEIQRIVNSIRLRDL